MRCMLAAKRPSISPQENQARSSKICARATAGPLLPARSNGLSLALLNASISMAALLEVLVATLPALANAVPPKPKVAQHRLTANSRKVKDVRGLMSENIKEYSEVIPLVCTACAHHTVRNYASCASGKGALRADMVRGYVVRQSRLTPTDKSQSPFDPASARQCR